MNMKHAMVAVVALLAVVCVLPAADAAYFSGDMPDRIEIDDNDAATIAFSVYSDSNFPATITVTEGDRKITTIEQDITVGTNTIQIQISDLSIGTHNLRIECTPAGEFDGFNGFNVTVVVDQSLLSNWVTYVVIIVVVIVIAIFAYLKIRDTPKSKPQMTFEELEAQRKAEMAEKADKKKKPSSSEKSSEKKRYVAEKKAEPKEQAPKMTFEELDAQKKAEKAAKAEKKSPGLTERERYLAEKRKKKE